MNKPSKAGESTREVRVAVACTGADGEPEMPIFIVPVTDAEFENGDHYGMAKEKAERYGYEEPFVCFDDRKQGPIRHAAAELAGANAEPEWTQQDMDQARAEGWDIFDTDGQLQIQRMDESPKNLTDPEAVFNAYVRAINGSAMHRKALLLVLAESNVRKNMDRNEPSVANAWQIGPSAVVRVQGGMVRDIISNVSIDVMVADYDVEGRDVESLPQLQSMTDTDTDEDVYVPADCQSPQVYVDPAFTESLIRTGRSDFLSDEAEGPEANSSDAVDVQQSQPFTVFVQQADGHGTVNISDYQAVTPEEAAEMALSQVSEDWGHHGPDGFVPWDKDDLRVLGIVKGNFEVVEWNDLDY